jgi:hypothetical protein
LEVRISAGAVEFADLQGGVAAWAWHAGVYTGDDGDPHDLLPLPAGTAGPWRVVSLLRYRLPILPAGRDYAAQAGYTRIDTLPIEHDMWRFYHLHP